MTIKDLPLKDLIPFDRNAKKHDETQIKNVMESIKQFGFAQPLVVDKDNVVIIGHCRLIAAKRLKLKTVPTLCMDELNDDQVAKLRLLDNKLNESEWDFDLLSEDIPNLDFSDFDIDWGLPDGDILTDEEIQEDDVPDVPTEPKSKLGQLYKLGNHRLICGDSTDKATIERLMDGVKANMVFTDPPYNIASDSKNFAADVSKAMKDLSESEWDKHFDIKEVLNNIYNSISDNSTVYICTSHFLAPDIWNWMKEWSDHYSYCVWSKPNPMPSLSKCAQQQ